MTVIVDGTKGLNSNGGYYAQTTYTGTYTDGIVLDYTSGQGRISTGTSDVLSFFNGGVGTTELMRLDASGNLGIGTSSPSTYGKLAVFNSSATSTTQYANSNIWAISNASNADSNIAISNGVDHSAKIGIYNGANLYFALDGSERMRIDSSGNLLVGTTSAPTGGTSGVFISNPSTGSGILIGSSGTSSNSIQRFYNSNGQVGSIVTSGSSTAFNTSSDYRLKENVQPMTGALATVAQLKPCTYDWIVDKSQGQGFIAHELQAVVPDCVTGQKDAVDAQGNPIYQGVDTSFLVATLTAAIQELNTTVTTLQTQVAALQAKVGV